jgi:hypothetical protein
MMNPTITHIIGAKREIALPDYFTCTDAAGFTDGFVTAMTFNF